MDKFGNRFVNQSPRRLLFNLGVKFSIFSISNPVMWIFALFLGKTFSRDHVHHHGALASEIVTSLGLMQSINIIGIVFFIAIGAGSNTYIARIFGKFKTSKKTYTLNNLANDSDVKYIYGSTLFCFFILCILLTPIILGLGSYVARIQNFYLPDNYLKNIKILLTFYVLSLPFFGFITFNAYHLNSEGSAGVCSLIGILNVAFFVAFCFLFNSILKSGCFLYRLNPHTQQNQIIIFNIGCALLATGVLLLISMMFILYFLKRRGQSIIFQNLKNIFWVKVSVLRKIIRISLPIYVRVMVSFLTIIMLNITLEFLPFPTSAAVDFHQVAGPTANQPPLKQLYATYWQYIIFSINSVFIIIYRIIASFTNTSIRASLGFYYGQQNYAKIYECIKWAFIYGIIIVFAYEIIFSACATTILKNLFGIENQKLYEVTTNSGNFQYKANHILTNGRNIFLIWNSTIFIIALQYLCPGVSLTLGRVKITYFMFVIDKIIFSIPFMIIVLLINRSFFGGHNYLLFFSFSIFSDILTFLVALMVIIHLLITIKRLEIAHKIRRVKERHNRKLKKLMRTSSPITVAR